MAGISRTRNGTANAPAVAAISPPLGSVRFLPITLDRGDGQQHPEQHRAGVAHEDLRGMEVPGQEPDADARGDGREQRGLRRGPQLARIQHDIGEEEGGRDRHHPRREPVEAVERGSRRSGSPRPTRSSRSRAGPRRGRTPRAPGTRGRTPARRTAPGRPAMNTWAMNFDRAVVPLVSSITPRPSISVHVTSAAAEWLLVRLMTSKNGRNWEAASATTKPDVHRDAAHRRERHAMHRAVVRLVDRAHADHEPANERRDEEGHGRGRDEHDQVGGHVSESVFVTAAADNRGSRPMGTTGSAASSRAPVPVPCPWRRRRRARAAHRP